MAFTFDVNVGTSTNSPIMYRLKSGLVTAGWTVVQSSNGVSSSSSDLITSSTVLDVTKAWFTLRHPNSTLYINIQAVTPPNSYRIKVSLTGFTTGGTATVVPSATDEFAILGGGTDASPTGAAINDSVSTLRGSILIGGAAENYSFMMFSHVNGVSGVRGTFMFDAMQPGTYPSAETRPFVFYSTALTTDIYNYGGSLSNTASWTCFPWDAAGTTYKWRRVHPMSMFSGTSSTIPGALGGDKFTGNDLIFPVLWARPSYTGTGNLQDGPGVIKGFSSLLYWSGGTRAYGDTLNVNGGTKNYMMIGGTATPSAVSTVIPWNGTDLTI